MANKRSVPDITEVDLSKDGDTCSPSELKEAYQQPFHCSARKAVGLEKLFVLHLDADWNSNRLATALSNNSIHLSSIDMLEKVSTFIAHNDNIVDVHFSPQDPNCLYSASSDGSIRLWDWRSPGKHSQEFKDDSDQKAANKPFMSFDVNCKGQFLCAGTEKVKDDSYLLFWDVRSSKLLGGYWESHEDDVSHVHFHPTEPDTLASCSTDCLINVFNISESDEDDALQFSLNAETSCGRLQWLTRKKADNGNTLSVITHTEDVQLWDVEEATKLQSFSREQVRDALKRRNTETCYSVRCFSRSPEEDPLVLAGSSTPQRGCLRLLRITKDSLEPYAVLYDQKGANSQVVRCAAMHPSNGALVSGGEDGIINVWTPGVEKSSASAANTMVDLPTRSSAHKGRSSAKKPYAK